jgi:translation elongation factor EF-Tu-like GTPase
VNDAARAPDIEGDIRFLTAAEGGRQSAARSSYMPAHRIHDNYQTSGRHVYPDVEQVRPGESARVHVWFITPHVYPRCLWPGRELDVMEGTRVVARLRVTRVVNEALAVRAEDYAPMWTRPPGLE